MDGKKRTPKGEIEQPNIDFDTHLTGNGQAYDTPVGDWWQERTLDLAHRKAYQHIAMASAGFCDVMGFKSPLLLDYTCGGGALIGQLLHYFPKAKIIGLDGSRKLLEACRDAHTSSCELLKPKEAFALKPKSRVRLTQSILPNFRLPKHQCDVVFLVFPNLVPDSKHLDDFNRHGYGHKIDNQVARMLSRFREMDPEDETVTTPPDDLFDDLMTHRVYSRNLRQLLKLGGLLVRVEYTQDSREVLTELTQWRILFGEGALEESIKGVLAKPFFHLIGSEYKTSQVILDVFHQTGNPDDRKGGYMLSFFEAI